MLSVSDHLILTLPGNGEIQGIDKLLDISVLNRRPQVNQLINGEYQLKFSVVLNGIGTIFPEDIWKSMGAFLVVIVTVEGKRYTIGVWWSGTKDNSPKQRITHPKCQ